MLTDYLNLFWRVFKDRLSPPNSPFICTYITTWRCNAKCVMCKIWEKEKKQEMNIEEITKVFSKIKNIGLLRITGGEPFLREDLTEVANTIVENTAVNIMHVTTNGILGDRIIDFIKNVKFKNIHLKITLNGYMDNHDRIMGVPGAWNKTIETIEKLRNLPQNYKFVLGINQTIVDKQSYEDSKKIRLLCSKYKISYLPVIACNNMPLYDPDSKGGQPEPDFESFGDFSKDDFKIILKDLIAETSKIDNYIERAVKRYYLAGLYNRLILDKKIPNPNCVALRKHIRILPDGQVPVCLFSSATVGNLLKNNFSDIWNSPNATRLRKQIKKCDGCWDECETIPNALYSNSTIKYMMPLNINAGNE